MTTKVQGTNGIEFPDGSVQSSAAYDKTAADSRYVNVAGDTMTGQLTLNAVDQIKLVLKKGVAGVGNNYIDFQDNAGQTTGYIGHGSSSNNSMQISASEGLGFYSDSGWNWRNFASEDRMLVDAAGNVGIYNGYQMNLYPAGGNYEIVNRASGSIALYCGSGSKFATLANDGLWSTPAAVSYTANAANMHMFPGGAMTMGSTSARKFKTNIRPLEYGLAQILAIDTIRYNSLCEGDNIEDEYIGLIADDVQGDIPELVVLDTHGEVAGFDYAKLSVVLINAVKELSTKLDAALARITELEAK